MTGLENVWCGLTNAFIVFAKVFVDKGKIAIKELKYVILLASNQLESKKEKKISHRH